MPKPETRIIPGETTSKFYAQHLKPYEFIIDKVEGKKILEIGCGDGYGAAYLSSKASEVYAVDYEEGVILKAKDKYRINNLNFQSMDAASLKFEDGYFDLACSFQVIEHIPEDKILKYLLEVKRVLNNNGSFYLSTLNIETSMKSPAGYKKNPAHIKEFNLYEIREELLKVFPNVLCYGLHLTGRHRFYQRLKKIGMNKVFPGRINFVNRFYGNITTDDFVIRPDNLRKAIDFICICENYG